MEANRRRRVVPRRKALSDITNTPLPISRRPNKTNPPSSFTSSSAPYTRVTESTTVAAATTSLDNAPNPNSSSPPVPSTALKTPSLHADSITPSSIRTHEMVDAEASDDVEGSEPVQHPISVVYSRRRRRPFSTTPNLKISDSRCDEFEGLNLSKAKALTFPRAKKQRSLPEEDPMKDPQFQEYIEKMNAYFKEVDEFELEIEYLD